MTKKQWTKVMPETYIKSCLIVPNLCAEFLISDKHLNSWLCYSCTNPSIQLLVCCKQNRISVNTFLFYFNVVSDSGSIARKRYVSM